MDLQRAKQRLTTALADLDQRERAARSEDDTPQIEGAVGQHPADYGTDLANEMERNLLVQTLDREREQTLDALRRVEEGTYGLCAVDGEPIEEARLQARPAAVLCLRHQEEAERRL